MGSNYGILAGLLGGFGGAAQQIGGAFTRQQEEQLAREKLAIEQQRADQAQAQNAAVIAESQATRLQNQSQFDATQKAASTPIASLYKFLGVPVPANVDPYERVPTAMGDKLLSGMQAQQTEERTRARDQALNSQTQAFLQSATAQPGTSAVFPPDESAMYSEGTPATDGRPAMSRFDVGAGLAGLGHKDAGIKALMETLYPSGGKFTALGENSPGVFNNETGAFTSIDRPGGATAVEPPQTPGMRNVQAVDARGRTTWTQQAIGVGSDREGEATARGYRSFAEAPQSVQAQINTALDTQGLRRSERQGVEAAKLNAKPLTEDEAKGMAASTAALGALGELNRFSPAQISQYVGLLKKPIAEAQQILAGATGGVPDKDFIAFKVANARLQATMFDIAGKAVTETEKKVVLGYIPTGDEPNAETYLAKVRGFDAYTRAARETKLEMTRTGRGSVAPAEYDQRLADALAKTKTPAPSTVGGSADERARRKFLGQ